MLINHLYRRKPGICIYHLIHIYFTTQVSESKKSLRKLGKWEHRLLAVQPDQAIHPELFGRTILDSMGEVTLDLEGITTAREVLRSIELRVLSR